jgi:uncharacterized protein YndB with AHSA1/START domain
MESDGHSGLLPSASEGCLLIADVSGYTTYLVDTELEHAQDVLADLIETILASLQPTLQIAELEGDAVFAYAVTDEIEAGMLLDTIDQTYFAFRSRLRDITQATSCTCQACRRIPTLDLKLVVHHGRFVRTPVGGTKKPAGPDVVVVHRLLKNSVRERLGVDAYALVTSPCVEALDVDPAALGWVEHRERYDDVGEVFGYVEDLGERWRAEQERRRVVVPAGEADLEMRQVFPVPPPVLWEYLTAPDKRLVWQSADQVDESNPSGRRGAGTTNHCVHGKTVFVEEILDWRPFSYFTIRFHMPVIGPWVFTHELVEAPEGGTEFLLRAERLTGWRKLAWAFMRRSMTKGMTDDLDRLLQLTEELAPAPAPG